MMDLSHRRKWVVRRIIWLSAVSALTLSVLALAQPSSAVIAVVDGTVTDQIGNPLEGANVTINIWNSDMTQIDWTDWDIDFTDEDGFYTVTFGGMIGYNLKEGETIEVIATHLSESGSNTYLVDDAECIIYNIDVTIEALAIPEFGLGQSIGLPLVIIAVIAIFAVMSRKRS